MLRVVEDDDLPGELAVACSCGEFVLFVTAGALSRGHVRTLAHDASHMLQNTSKCSVHCEDFTARIELWMVDAHTRERAQA